MRRGRRCNRCGEVPDVALRFRSRAIAACAVFIAIASIVWVVGEEFATVPADALQAVPRHRQQVVALTLPSRPRQLALGVARDFNTWRALLAGTARVLS